MPIHITKLKLRKILLNILIRDSILLSIGVLSICVCFYLTYLYQNKLTSQLYPLNHLLHKLNSSFKDNNASFTAWLNSPTLNTKIYSLKKSSDNRYQLLKEIELHSKNLPYKNLIYLIQKDTRDLYWEQWNLSEMNKSNKKSIHQNTFFKELIQTTQKARKNIEYLILAKDKNANEKFFDLYDNISKLQYNLINNFYTESDYFTKKIKILTDQLKKLYNNIDLSNQEKKILNQPLQKLFNVAQKSLTHQNSYYGIIHYELKSDYNPLKEAIQKNIDKIIIANENHINHDIKIINILILIEFAIITLILFLFIIFGFVNVKKIISFILKPIEYLSKNIDLATKGGAPSSNKNENYIFEFSELVKDFEYMMKQREEQTTQLTYLAHHDKQTGIYNYSYLEELFDKMVGKLNTQKNDILIIYIKILKYDEITAILGEVAAANAITIFTKALSQFKLMPFLCAKIGESKFLITTTIKNDEDINTVLTELSAHAHFCLAVSKLSDLTKCIIGAVKYSEYPATLPILLQYCKFAAGHPSYHLTYHLFNKKSKNIFKRASTLEMDIRTAVENNQLFIQYQPQYALIGQQLVGCEALIRWQHPEFGIINPSEFIPIAEKSECILSIGRFVQQKTAEDYASWFNEIPTHKKIMLAINASIIEILSQDYEQHLLSILNKYHISPSLIEIEITESMIALYLKDIKVIVKRLKESGVNIAIDDFGTGYSSLERLLSFDFDLLKIDKSFVDKAIHDEKSKKLLSSVISLANNIDIKTLAEGVETSDQVALLTSLKCDYVQGFYFSNPISSEEMTQLIAMS